MIDHEGVLFAKKKLEEELKSIGEVPEGFDFIKTESDQEITRILTQRRQINRAYQRYSERLKVCHATEDDVVIKKMKKDQKNT